MNLPRIALYVIVALALVCYVLAKAPLPGWLIHSMQVSKQGLNRFEFPPAP